jgi:CRISPR-associated RAMP protein (TIGR02581 family)
MNLDKIFNQIVIDVRLQVERTLLVGSGQGDITPGGVDVPQIKMTTSRRPDLQGEPYVPGSSLKGAIRATCEAVIRTFVDAYQQQGILCYDDAPEERTTCGKTEDKADKPLCMMCDTFGNINRISKVSFDDAFLTDASMKLLQDAMVQHRTGVRISRKTGAVDQGALFSVEFIPRGAEFEFRILCTNILPAEMKLILLALQLFNDGRFKLGGQKSRGMGAVKFLVPKVTTYLPKLYRFDPFARQPNGAWRWRSEEEILDGILARSIGNETKNDFLEGGVMYETPPEGWQAVSAPEGLAYLRDQFVPRLYPVGASDKGMFSVQIRPADKSHPPVTVGRYMLSPGGDLSKVKIEEQINQMEYAITSETTDAKWLAEIYRSAFEFLGGIEKESRASEELRLPGTARLPITFQHTGADGKMLIVKKILQVTPETKRVHDLLIWLGWARTLIALA